MWRDQPAVFEGVLLSDLLAAHDLQAAGDITVTAENDFVSLFSPEVLNATPILVATRVDGRPHSRRARGPFQFVVDADAFEQSEALEESHLVWMAARIEAGR